MEAASLPANNRLLARASRRIGRSGWAIRLSLGVVILAALAALLGPWVAPYDPNDVDLGAALQGPSSAHWLGTDATGRDILSRVLVGARPALLAPLAVSLLTVALGVVVGVGMAWRRGAVDAVGIRALDVIFAFPALLAAILAVAMFGKGLAAPVIALAIVYLPWVARLVRAAALRERQLPYVAAMTVQGFSGWRIMTRHLLPNLAPLISAQAVIAFSYAMIDLSAINFLGLGLQPPTADWGAMVASGQSAILGGDPQESLSACVCIVAVIVSVNVLGEQLARDA
jgi:peptide/nickel transport system permease protein